MKKNCYKFAEEAETELIRLTKLVDAGAGLEMLGQRQEARISSWQQLLLRKAASAGKPVNLQQQHDQIHQIVRVIM